MKKKYAKTKSSEELISESKSLRKEVTENDSKTNSSNIRERIVERLDLQLLITIIVFFVSAWAFLNGSICGFTESANHNEVINYMLVHYVLTLTLFLCVYITYLKGKFIVDRDISVNKDKYFSLFMDSWFWALLLCIIILWLSTSVPWWVFYVLLIFSFYYEVRKLKFDRLKRIVLIVWFIGCFPLFISTMTLANKNIVVNSDKEYYTIDEDILISINSQGYACTHKLVNLGSEELYQNTQYIPDKNMIVLKASTIKNNRIAVGTVSPASGMPNFFVYPLRKMFNKDSKYVDINNPNNEKYINYVSKGINVKP